MRAFIVSTALLAAASAHAEAGVPNLWCGAASCACGSVMCTCGQVCNLAQQRCDPPQGGFCSSDPQCAASACGPFICEMNVCVPGTRGAAGGSGTAGGASAGGAAGGSSGGAGTAGGSAVSPPPAGCGCAASPSLAVLMTLSLLRRRLARRC